MKERGGEWRGERSLDLQIEVFGTRRSGKGRPPSHSSERGH